MRLDPAAVHRQGRGFDRPPPPAENAARLSFAEIPVAEFGDGHAAHGLGFGRHGIDALGHRNQFLMGEVAGLLDGHQSEAPNDRTAQPAFGRAKLDDKALEARRHDLDAEAAQFLVPHENLPNLDPILRRFRSFESVDKPLGELFRSHINHLLEV